MIKNQDIQKEGGMGALPHVTSLDSLIYGGVPPYPPLASCRVVVESALNHIKFVFNRIRFLFFGWIGS